MAIHDIGSGNNRSNSMPLRHDAASERKADGTQGVTNKVDGSTGAYVSTRNGRILVNDGTNNRVIIGMLPDGTFGMVISKDGVDVEDLF